MVQNRLQKGDTWMTIKEMSHLHILAIRITNGFVVVGWQRAQTGPISLCNDLSCQTVINGPISAERHVHQSQCRGARRTSPACLLQPTTHHGLTIPQSYSVPKFRLHVTRGHLSAFCRVTWFLDAHCSSVAD